MCESRNSLCLMINLFPLQYLIFHYFHESDFVSAKNYKYTCSVSISEDPQYPFMLKVFKRNCMCFFRRPSKCLKENFMEIVNSKSLFYKGTL